MIGVLGAAFASAQIIPMQWWRCRNAIREALALARERKGSFVAGHDSCEYRPNIPQAGQHHSPRGRQPELLPLFASARIVGVD